MISRWQSVESSNVEAVGFDEDTKEIIVLFKNGSLYAYDPATAIFNRFLEAESKGKYVNDVLKQDGFPVRRIT